MAAAGDARDILGMPAVGGPVQPPTKKAKVVAGPRVTGMKREIQDLQGDHAPPIPLTHNKYKSKPAYMNKAFKPRHYELRPFQNNARTDGLVLRHWKRKRPTSDAVVLSGVSGREKSLQDDEDSRMIDADAGQNGNLENGVTPILRYDDEFPLEKFNVRVDVPSYTDEEYDLLLKSDDWTKEETDYLMGLCKSYDLRWFVISDRYEKTVIPLPPHIRNNNLVNGDAMITDSIEIPTVYPDRTLEDLKARYYSISSTMIEKHNPPSDMNEREWKNWDLANRYDSEQEKQRKRLAESLFARSEDEATEEKLLLAELKRILKDEDDWLASRQDVASRLDFSPTKSRRDALPDGQESLMERTSAGLSLVLQQLLTKERANKGLRRPTSITDMNGAANTASSGGPTWEKGHHPNQYSRRNTMQSQASEDAAQTPTIGPQKKGSMVAPPSIRQLTPAEEAKYGVTHPTERITSGVSFRNERAAKIATAKSQVQTQKIQSALAELGVPVRLVMPTERVVREFEVLVGEINLLLDVRKHYEKVTSEIAVYEGVRKRRLAEEGGEEQPNGQITEIDKPATELGLPQNMDVDAGMEDSGLEAAANANTSADAQDPQKSDAVGDRRQDEDEDEDMEDVDESKLDQADEDEGAEERTKSVRRASSNRSYGDDENEEDVVDNDEDEGEEEANEEEDEDEGPPAAAAEDESDEDDIGKGLGEDNDEVEEDEDVDIELNADAENEEPEEDEDEADQEENAQDQDDDDDGGEDNDDNADDIAANSQSEEEADDDVDDADDANDADEQNGVAAVNDADDNDNDNDVAIHTENEGEGDEAEEQGLEQGEEPETEAEAEAEPPRTRKASAAASAVSAVTAAHKRSASVISDTSRAGSSRSGGGGRKRARK